MHAFIKTALNIYIYSSIHIGICVTAMILQTYFYLGIDLSLNPFVYFSFFSTLLIYSLHKVVGAYRSRTPNIGTRIQLFYTYRKLFILYTILIIPFCIYFLLQLDKVHFSLLILPGIISLLYIFPIDMKGRRLRDFAYIKLFLIAIVWVIITVIIPMIFNYADLTFMCLMGLEKLFFMIALTLPFDIRDVIIDETSGVKTLAGRLGKEMTFQISSFLISLSLIILLVSYISGYISSYYLLIMLLAYGLSLIAIKYSLNKTHDFYYGGLLDGMMLIPFLLIQLSMSFFG